MNVAAVSLAPERRARRAALLNYFSLQFVQHPDLLCPSVRTGPAWAGNYGCFPALRSAVACESFPA